MRTLAPAAALALFLGAAPARAECEAYVPFSSWSYATQDYSAIYTPGVYDGFPEPPFGPPVSVTTDLVGVFWEIGLGHPAVGLGVDNGTFPALEDYGSGYFVSGWVYNYGPYPSRLYGHWARPGVDGCIGGGTDCMAVLLNDRDAEGHSWFALLAAPRGAGDDGFAFVQPGGAPITLAETPVPVVVATTSDDGPLEIELAAIDAPPAGLYLAAPGCDEALVTGYRVYQQATTAGEPPPVDRARDAGWVLAFGGSGPHEAPLAPGAATRVTATDCSENGTLWLVTTLVIDEVFELPYVSANGTPVACGSCELVDADEDGATTGPCTPRAAFDCSDDDPRVFPAAAQACDGVNNDCLHPGWPGLADTGEIDDDGDGVTGCAGDPCPLDAADDEDGDGVCGDLDVCPQLYDPEQPDADGDGRGDLCDVCPADPADDRDGDALCADADNCPDEANADQLDADADALGDACDACPLDPENDVDLDRICGDVDACPHDTSNDADDDGQCGDVDPCPFDRDDDADADTRCANDDNCPVDANLDQLDADVDGFGDACDRFGATRTIDGDVGGAHGIAVADVDADGRLDVVSLAQNDGTVQWHRNVDGVGNTWARHPIAALAQPRHVLPFDLDGDGTLDVLHASRDAVAWHANLAGDGTSWAAHTISTTFRFPRRLTVADFDGDGDPDVGAIAFDDTDADRLVWYENVAGDATAWIDHPIAVAVVDSAALDAADVDGDGDVDLLLGEGGFLGGGRRLLLIENRRGDGSAWAGQEIAADREYLSLAAVDVDGDGDRDLLVAVGFGVGNQRGGTYWYENRDGLGGEWSERVVALTNVNHEALAAADMDGDGDVDALVATSTSGLLVWHENVAADGSVWKDRPVRTLSGINNVTAAADVDGDGDVDAVAGTGNAVMWIERVAAGNIRPTAVAGGDRAVECGIAAATTVVLDGRGSDDPDGAIETFAWYEDFGTATARPLGDGALLEVELSLGPHLVTLVVTDSAGASDLAAFMLDVLDTTPPALTLDLMPAILWPADGNLVTVIADPHGADRCSGLAGLTLVAVTSDEPRGESADIADAELDTADTEIALRAERAPDGDGRTYTVTWRATDLAGNAALVGATVGVPLDADGAARLLRLTLDRDPAGARLDWTSVTAPALYVVVRGTLPAVQGGDLGPLTCAGADLTDTHLVDAAEPAPGDALFWLVGLRTPEGDHFGSQELPPNPCAPPGR